MRPENFKTVCVCSSNSPHRGIWNAEAQNSASTKIIITCFFVAPPVSKSQPAAITGARMNSCLEVPEAVSLSAAFHSLCSLGSNKREERWGLVCPSKCTGQTIILILLWYLSSFFFSLHLFLPLYFRTSFCSSLPSLLFPSLLFILPFFLPLFPNFLPSPFFLLPPWLPHTALLAPCLCTRVIKWRGYSCTPGSVCTLWLLLNAAASVVTGCWALWLMGHS